jgi:hypothetical protein
VSKATPSTAKPAIRTVGDLISELCLLPDHAEVSFRCPMQHRELRLFRIARSSNGHVEIEFDTAPDAAPALPMRHRRNGRMTRVLPA